MWAKMQQVLFLRRGLIFVAACALASLWAMPQGRAQESGPWLELTQSRLRIISAGPPQNGLYHAGIEIALEGQALTYWRSPGDVGVAPDLLDDGSDNLAAFGLTYPAPQRYEEAGAEVYGYKNSVLFPLMLTPKDPSRPVRAQLILNYAVCDKLCIPVQAKLSLMFAPSASPSTFADAIARAESMVPQRITEGPELIAIEASAAGHKRWRLQVPAAMGTVHDIFAEAPQGWFFATIPTAQGPVLEVVQSPSASDHAPVPSIITIETNKGAYEWPSLIKDAYPR